MPEGRDVAPRRHLLRRDRRRGTAAASRSRARGDRRALPESTHAVRAGVPVHARHRALDGIQRALHGRHGRASRPNTIFDPLALWELIERTGELPGHRRRRVRASVARRARRADGRALDVSSLRVLLSGGAILSPSVKRALRRAPPERARCRRLRRVGDRRPGPVGRRRGRRRSRARRASASRRHAGARRRSAAGRPPASSAGSPRRGHIPLGYYKDPEKTAATFPVDRRRALGGARRPRGRRGRRHRSRCSAAARSRSTRAARRSTPKRSSRSLKAHADGVRRGRRRRARRALGRAGRRRRAAARPGPHRRSTTLAGARARASRRLQGAARRRARRRDRALPSGKPDYRWAKATPRSRSLRVRSRRDRTGWPTRRARTSASTPTTPSTGIPWGDEAFARARDRRQADLPVGRLLVVPLVPRDGPRVVRGRRDAPR